MRAIQVCGVQSYSRKCGSKVLFLGGVSKHREGILMCDLSTCRDMIDDMQTDYSRNRDISSVHACEMSLFKNSLSFSIVQSCMAGGVRGTCRIVICMQLVS